MNDIMMQFARQLMQGQENGMQSPDVWGGLPGSGLGELGDFMHRFDLPDDRRGFLVLEPEFNFYGDAENTFNLGGTRPSFMINERMPR